MKLLYCILAMLPALLFGQDWKLQHRTIVLVDFFQTEQFVKRTPGVYEKNPYLRGSTISTALNMAIHSELYIWLIDQLPKDVRPVLGTLLGIVRSSSVIGNARLGAPQPFYVPLVSIRF